MKSVPPIVSAVAVTQLKQRIKETTNLQISAVNQYALLRYLPIAVDPDLVLNMHHPYTLDNQVSNSFASTNIIFAVQWLLDFQHLQQAMHGPLLH